MTSRNLFDSLRGIDDELILDAAPDKHRNPRALIKLRRGAIAACLALTVLTGAAMAVLAVGRTVSMGEVTRRYKYTVSIVGRAEMARLWPWEYQTLTERYPSAMWNGAAYRTGGGEIDASLLSEVLGTCEAQGYDMIHDTVYTERFEVRAIGHIDPEKLVALGLDGSYYVYRRDDEEHPATWGEVLDAYDLENTLRFSRFSEREGYAEGEYWQIDDDAFIWEVLTACRDAAWVEDPPSFLRDKRYISFTATSEQLGVYKRVFYVTEDGYIQTNVFDYGHTFHIGEEASRKIIDYVTANAEKAAYEPYQYTVSGTLTEIGDGYILIDDSILCAPTERGMVFRVSTDDLRVRRVIECGEIDVGDIVVIHFTDGIVAEGDDYIINSAVDMAVGVLYDGSVSVPE